MEELRIVENIIPVNASSETNKRREQAEKLLSRLAEGSLRIVKHHLQEEERAEKKPDSSEKQEDSSS